VTTLPAQRGDAADFWRGRRVLLTGHTGFKGAWMSLWFRALGAEVTGFALPPSTEPNLWSIVRQDARSIIGDIRDEALIRKTTLETDPQIVVHMAAQALVRESYLDPLGTYSTNVMGTANLLQACRGLRHLECVLVITSDKVYDNRGEGRAFREDDALGGHDPYSNSKACAELVTSSFRHSFYADGPPLATARAGNVIAGGDWSTDRLIPDCVRALDADRRVYLRSPEAVRPWQHVLEPLAGYLAILQSLVQAPEATPRAVNFGPDPASFCTVREVVDTFSSRFAGRPGWQRDPGKHPPEAPVLTLSSELAVNALGWRPQLSIQESLSWTADWYRGFREGENMLAFSQEQIRRYRQLAGQSP
jgi:CDP-glucose 4,6-dehydratase